jgi:hypothetical protein
VEAMEIDVATFPFPPDAYADLTPGSFLSGFREIDFSDIVWRVRRWNLYGTITWYPREVTIPPIEPVTTILPNPSYIYMGESNRIFYETAQYVDIDDIFSRWRETRSIGEPIVDSPRTAGFDVRFGSGSPFTPPPKPRGSYDTNGDPEMGGSLDSEIFITLSNGDDNFYLGTQLNRDTGAGLLDQDSNVEFTYIDSGGNIKLIPLYFNQPEIGVSGTDDWTGELRLEPGGYWPWIVGGVATFDVVTGVRLNTPINPRCYLCEQS